jgi:DNA-binding transcriptional LysR family regulator
VSIPFTWVTDYSEDMLIPAPMPVSLLYAHRRNLPKRVRVFMDWVTGVLQPVFTP